MANHNLVKDMVGQRVGILEVVQRHGLVQKQSNPPRFGATWLCRCDCGAEVVLSRQQLRHSKWRSCGCAKAPPRPQRPATRGARTYAPGKLAAYKSFIEMRKRCSKTATKRAEYKRYAARGITVCPEWKTFEGFYADMGDRPDGMTLDRRDNDLGYSKANCRWATRAEQGRNSRNVTLGVVSVCLMRHMHRRGASTPDLMHAFGVSQSTVLMTVKRFNWRNVLTSVDAHLAA